MSRLLRASAFVDLIVSCSIKINENKKRNCGNSSVCLAPWRVSRLLPVSAFVDLIVSFDECELVKVRKSQGNCGRWVRGTWRLLREWSIVVVLLCKKSEILSIRLTS